MSGVEETKGRGTGSCVVGLNEGDEIGGKGADAVDSFRLDFRMSSIESGVHSAGREQRLSAEGDVNEWDITLAARPMLVVRAAFVLTSERMRWDKTKGGKRRWKQVRQRLSKLSGSWTASLRLSVSSSTLQNPGNQRFDCRGDWTL